MGSRGRVSFAVKEVVPGAESPHEGRVLGWWGRASLGAPQLAKGLRGAPVTGLIGKDWTLAFGVNYDGDACGPKSFNDVK